MSSSDEEIGVDGLPVNRDPALAEIAALPKDGPGRLAALLAAAAERLGEQVVAVEEMLGMRGEEAARHRLFHVDAFGARVQDIAERLSAVEAILAVPDPGFAEEQRQILARLTRVEGEVESMSFPASLHPRETRYAGTEVRVHVEGAEGIDPEAFKGPIGRALNADALLRRAENAEAEAAELGEKLAEAHRESEQLQMRTRELEGVIAPDGMAAASSHNPTYLLGRVRTLGQSNEKLSRFKALTHATLDAVGVPLFEEEDCRVKARLDWLVQRTIVVPEDDGEDVDLAAVRDIVDSLMFAAPETYAQWFPRLREALGMEG